MGERGGGGGCGGVGILRGACLIFFCTCKVEIFFFPPWTYIFWPESVGIYFFINNFLRKFFVVVVFPHPPPPYHFSNGPDP